MDIFNPSELNNHISAKRAAVVSGNRFSDTYQRLADDLYTLHLVNVRGGLKLRHRKLLFLIRFGGSEAVCQGSGKTLTAFYR